MYCESTKGQVKWQQFLMYLEREPAVDKSALYFGKCYQSQTPLRGPQCHGPSFVRNEYAGVWVHNPGRFAFSTQSFNVEGKKCQPLEHVQAYAQILAQELTNYMIMSTFVAWPGFDFLICVIEKYKMPVIFKNALKVEMLYLRQVVN
jgi:hypothetical protein